LAHLLENPNGKNPFHKTEEYQLFEVKCLQLCWFKQQKPKKQVELEESFLNLSEPTSIKPKVCNRIQSWSISIVFCPS
jgi:hypothetical protein